MNLNKRILIAFIILILVVGGILCIDAIKRQRAASQAPADMPPGSIPIFVNGEFHASFIPDDLTEIAGASFVDSEEGKTQEGWLFQDVILLHLPAENFSPESEVVVSSSSRGKSKTLTWVEIINPETIVMFDLAGKGTLKFVSNIPGFDIRDAWVQDVDKIEVNIR
jgi:hypothetical protein